jgi:hypothetical protein
MKRLITCAVLVALGFVQLAAAQEDQGPISWFALDTTTGGARSLVELTLKDDGPMYDGLLADGTLLSWGIAIPINHRPDDSWNYMLWATMSDWGKVGGLQAGFENLFATRSPEDMAASQKAYKEATVDGAHHDWVVRHHVHEVGAGEVRPRYFSTSYWKTKPGMEEKLTAFYRDSMQPVFEDLRTAGTIVSYGIFTQELHGDPEWTHVTWYAITSLAAIDTVGSALDAALSEEQLAEVFPIMEMEVHRDQVLLIVHLGGANTEE